MEIAEFDSLHMYEFIDRSSSKYNEKAPRNALNIDDIVLDDISDLDPSVELSVNVQNLLDSAGPVRSTAERNASLYAGMLPRGDSQVSGAAPRLGFTGVVQQHNACLQATGVGRMHLLESLPNDIPADLTECNPDCELLQPPSQMSLDQYDVTLLNLSHSNLPAGAGTHGSGVPVSRCPSQLTRGSRNLPCSLALVPDYVPPSHVSIPDMWDTLSDSSNPSISAATTPNSPVSDSCFSEAGTPTSGGAGSKFKMTRKGSSSKKRQLEKDSEEYRQRRERNNVAVRKSRDKTKMRHIQTESRVQDLTNENDHLKKRVDLLTKELTVLKGLFANVDIAIPPSLEQLLQDQ